MTELVSLSGGATPDVPCFLRLWHDVTRRHPDRVAVVDDGAEVTYAELASWVADLGELLAQHGVTGDTRVAVAGSRTAATLAAMLAVVSVGAAYVPLDSTYPEARLRHMLDDSGAKLLLYEAGPGPAFAAGRTALAIPDAVPGGQPRAPAVCGCRPDDPVYVIYTSGSTGRPNGVELPHRVIDNMVWWQVHHSKAVDLRTAQFAPLNFDVWFQEVLGTLCGGGTLVLVPESCRRDPFSLLALLVDFQVERLFLPYVGLQMLTLAAEDFDRTGELALKEVNVAGEQLLCTPAVRAFFEAVPECRLNNHYGQSESAMVTVHTLRGRPQEWPSLPPIGVPLPGCEVLVDLSAGDAEEGGDDGVGELLVCGAALGAGYINRPALNAERYVDVPETRHGHTRAFRTGDLVRVTEDGELVFLGRIDDEVKVRGFRVNPREVEAWLLREPDVLEAICVAVTMKDRSHQLRAAVLPRGPTIDVDVLVANLRGVLPEYAVPRSITVLEEVPRTPSGKIDRTRVAALVEERRRVRAAERAPEPAGGGTEGVGR